MTFIEATAHLHALAKAEADGKVIQYCHNGEWLESGALIANGNHVLQHPERYRIAPETKLRPWTIDEVPIGAVVRHKSGEEVMIVAKSPSGKVVLAYHGCVSLDVLFNYYTLLDGSPCGKEVAE